ncbi:MAG: hypothetical protein KDA87_08090 [Planctomycetales bacterium]|nr:hypothetical protein [Planctomycetales bacterium]
MRKPKIDSVRLIRRSDLEVVQVTHQGEPCLVLKDPIALNYVRMRPDEYFVLERLDGYQSLEELKDAYKRAYPNQRIQAQDLQSLLHRFHEQGLVLGEVAGQGEQLLQRARKKQRQKWLSTFSNLLFLRLGGIDPDRFLNRCLPYVRWMFHPVFLLLCLALVISAAGLVVIQWEEFALRIPNLQQMMTPESLLVMMLVLSLTKVLHELGHAFTCKYFGGECHQIGFMLLVFTPALYCDTSDSWLLPSRWKRAIVGAAGMGTEVVLAAIATFVWWNTEYGWVHYFSLRVIAVCSLSTVVFNANPLLRYDGYYILSDLLEAPNLAQRSTEVTLAWLRRLCLGVQDYADLEVSSWQRTGFFAYYFASRVYRCLVVFGILMVVIQFLRIRNFGSLAQPLIGFTLIGMFAPMMIATTKYVTTPGRSTSFRSKNLAGTLVACLVFVMFLLIPWPDAVYCPAVLQPAERHDVFVAVAGELDDVMIEPGQSVSTGAVLASLKNLQMQRDFQRVHAQWEQQNAAVRMLENLRLTDGQVAAQLPAARALRDELQRQLDKWQKRMESLQMTSDHAGFFYPPPMTFPIDDDSQLPTWHGDVLDSVNRNAYLQGGVQIGSLAAGNRWKAELLLDQSQRLRIEPGSRIQVCLHAFPDRKLIGAVRAIADRTATTVPRYFAGPGVTVPSPMGPQPISTSYLADADIDAHELPVIPGLGGEAKITCPPRSIAKRLQRWFAKTLRLQ